MKLVNQVRDMVKEGTLRSVVKKRLKMSDFQQGLRDSSKNSSGGKYILCPNEEDPILTNAKLDN